MGGIARRAVDSQSTQRLEIVELRHTSLESFFEVIRPDRLAISTCIATLARPIRKILWRIEFSLGQDGKFLISGTLRLPVDRLFCSRYQLGGRRRTS